MLEQTSDFSKFFYKSLKIAKLKLEHFAFNNKKKK